jgi:P27 family predicted phage terminase small subunit
VARELYDLGMISRLDRAALAAYCQAYGRWVEAERKLQDTPVILKMPSGYIQQNPWLTISTKQMELMCKFATELGMTPSSRSRVEILMRPSRSPIAADAHLNNRRPSDRFSPMRKPWEKD